MKSCSQEASELRLRGRTRGSRACAFNRHSVWCCVSDPREARSGRTQASPEARPADSQGGLSHICILLILVIKKSELPVFTDEELWALRVEATLRPSSWPAAPGLPAPKAILSLYVLVALSCPPLSETLIPGRIQVHYVLLSGHPGNQASPHIYFMPLSPAAKTRGRWSTKGEGGPPRKGAHHCLMPVMAASRGVSADKFGFSRLVLWIRCAEL